MPDRSHPSEKGVGQEIGVSDPGYRYPGNSGIWIDPRGFPQIVNSLEG